MLKKLTLFILMIIFSLILISCNTKESMTMDEYAKEYYQTFESLELKFNQELLKEIEKFLDVSNFGGYTHIDFVHYYDEYIQNIDATLYTLSLLGPQIENETIMKYQSKLEYNLFSLMDVMKLYREHQQFNSSAINFFSWIDELYNLFGDITPILIDINVNKLMIENELAANDQFANDTYYELKYDNLQSVGYISSIVASQVATAQDYSGLQVNPRNPIAIETNDGHWHSTAELDYSVMISTTKNLSEIMALLERFVIEQNINSQSRILTDEFFHHYLDTYTAYANIRSEYSYDFFKGGEFKEYQILNGTYMPQNGGSEGFPLHQFDVTLDDEHHLNEMIEYFNEIIGFLLANNHKQHMNLNY